MVNLLYCREIKEQDLVELKQKIEEVDKEMEKAK